MRDNFFLILADPQKSSVSSVPAGTVVLDELLQSRNPSFRSAKVYHPRLRGGLCCRTPATVSRARHHDVVKRNDILKDLGRGYV